MGVPGGQIGGGVRPMLRQNRVTGGAELSDMQPEGLRSEHMIIGRAVGLDEVIVQEKTLLRSNEEG